MKALIAVVAVLAGMVALPVRAEAAGTVTLTGTIRDGGPHGWPLWATVSVGDTSTRTSPVTGRYSLSVPAGDGYDVHVTAAGYQDATEHVTGTTADAGLPVDALTCRAPGYHYTTSGVIEGFDGSTAPSGWAVVDDQGNGQQWQFDDPGKRGNHTGGLGGFAVMDNEFYQWGRQDTSLVSPVVDLSSFDAPSVGFASDFTMFDYGQPSGIGDVDVSIDGGTTWQNAWRIDEGAPGPAQVQVPMPMAAHQSHVQVRFHYYNSPDITAGRWWELDDVYIGDRQCDPVPGGMVAGRVRDANTGQSVAGVRVAGPSSTTTTDADGRYAVFAPGTGRQAFTASKLQYHDRVQQVSVSADRVTATDFPLPTGRISVTPALHTDPRLGGSDSTPLVVTNSGTAPARVTLAERPGDFQLAAAPGEPWSGIGDPPAAGWQSLPDYPLAIRDNVAGAYHGKIYSFGGVPSNTFGEPTAQGFAYDPDTREWSPVADLPRARQEGVGAFIGDKFYVVDGATGELGQELAAQLDIYDPATDSWSTGASIPVPMADAAATVLDGQLYVVGGCDTRFFCGTSGVFRYDPGTDKWQRLADYPTPESWLACGAIEAMIYCTGGQQDFGDVSTATYAYDPAANTWSRRADLPLPLWNMGYGTANGKLLVSGGVYNTLSTGKGFAYDPVADAWTPLPNAINELARGATACGFYKIGGAQSWSSDSPFVEMLPGYSDCGSDRDSAWLSLDTTTVTVPPRHSAVVWVRADAHAVDQPGKYSSAVLVRSDTPYGTKTVDVTMRVDPPSHWAKVMGTVTGTSCDGTSTPLAGANVWIAGDHGGQQTLTTDADGRYALWLDDRGSPLQVTAGMDGWLPKPATARLRSGRPTVQDFVLPELDC